MSSWTSSLNKNPFPTKVRECLPISYQPMAFPLLCKPDSLEDRDLPSTTNASNQRRMSFSSIGFFRFTLPILYGYKQIAGQLHVSHKRAYRVMRLYGIRAKTTRRCRAKNQYNTSKSSLPNLMKDMQINHPNQAWAGDFTHFTFKRRTYYLATIMDICTRRNCRMACGIKPLG